MRWLKKAKWFEDNKIYASEIITCDVMKEFEISNVNDFASTDMKITEDTFDIFCDYIEDWLSNTIYDYELANNIKTGLITGILDKKFTIENVKNDDNKVREYINRLV